MAARQTYLVGQMWEAACEANYLKYLDLADELLAPEQVLTPAQVAKVDLLCRLQPAEIALVHFRTSVPLANLRTGTSREALEDLVRLCDPAELNAAIRAVAPYLLEEQ